MLVTRDVSSWLYLLIGGSFIVTLIMISKGLDKFGKNGEFRAPSILPISEFEALETYKPKAKSSRNLHHIAPLPPKLPPLAPPNTRVRSTTLKLPTKAEEKILMERALELEANRVQKELDGFEFVNGGELSNYLMDTGGQPVRAMVATTWRSGSTFLGDIMDAHPATYYHYEPLLHFDIQQARTGRLAQEGVRVLRDLMACNYSNLTNYLEYGKSHNWLFLHNKRLWKYCTAQGAPYSKSYCWKPEFLNRFCPLFPFQSIKTVRLRLNLTQALVEDPRFKVKVLLLVRDPRGTIQSRKHRDWCPGNPDCEDPAKLCGDLVSDYHSAKRLIKQFPDRYSVARYEDFSMDPYNNSVSLFKFFGYTMHTRVKEFLDTHTKVNKGGVSSTFRDSKTAPFKWRERLTKEEVFTIQESCKEAMDLWGYRLLGEEDDLSELQAVIDLEHFTLH